MFINVCTQLEVIAHEILVPINLLSLHKLILYKYEKINIVHYHFNLDK